MGLKPAGLRGSLRQISTGAFAIPDTSMFQNAEYQFYAGSYGGSDGDSPVTFPEVLAGLSDPTAVGSPTFQADQSDGTDTYDAIEYDPNDGDNDGHDWTPDAQLPTGSDPFAIAILMWVRSTSGETTPFAYGNNSTNETNGISILDTGEVRHFFFGNDLDGSTAVPTGEFITIGARYDGSSLRKVFLNGSADGSDDPGTVNVTDSNHGLGYWSAVNGQFVDAYIPEIILCTGSESDQAFTDYHNDRLG